MKLVRTLPLLLAPLSALALALHGGQQTGQEDPPTADVPPRAGQGIRGTPDRAKLPQGIGNHDVGALDIFGRPSRARVNTLVERIQGGWQLTAMEMLGSDSAGRLTEGFLNMGASYMSLELHASWAGESKSIEYDIHTVFTAEYTLDATGRLIAHSIIGSYIAEETGRLMWEDAGIRREFFVTETDKELILTYDQGKSRLVFTPRAPRMLGRRDIFGRREIVDPLDNSIGTDIFGRKSTDTEGVRDIFGRIVPEKVPGEAKPGEGDEGDKKVIDPRDTPPGGGG